MNTKKQTPLSVDLKGRNTHRLRKLSSLLDIAPGELLEQWFLADCKTPLSSAQEFADLCEWWEFTEENARAIADRANAHFGETLTVRPWSESPENPTRAGWQIVTQGQIKREEQAKRGGGWRWANDMIVLKGELAEAVQRICREESISPQEYVAGLIRRHLEPAGTSQIDPTGNRLGSL
ncbi:MAG: hypothetical protein JJT96_12445 [Opitutales bacterium]|nr:hypothetical protein [Opitutales bacterium]